VDCLLFGGGDGDDLFADAFALPGGAPRGASGSRGYASDSAAGAASGCAADALGDALGDDGDDLQHYMGGGVGLSLPHHIQRFGGGFPPVPLASSRHGSGGSGGSGGGGLGGAAHSAPRPARPRASGRPSGAKSGRPPAAFCADGADGRWMPREGLTHAATLPALRVCYRRAYGKETTSNNRQWLLRRLAILPGAPPALVAAYAGGARGGPAHMPPLAMAQLAPLLGDAVAGLTREPLAAPLAAPSLASPRRAAQQQPRGDVAASGSPTTGNGVVPGQGVPRASGKRAVKPNRHFADGDRLDGRPEDRGLGMPGAFDALAAPAAQPHTVFSSPSAAARAPPAGNGNGMLTPPAAAWAPAGGLGATTSAAAVAARAAADRARAAAASLCRPSPASPAGAMAGSVFGAAARASSGGSGGSAGSAGRPTTTAGRLALKRRREAEALAQTAEAAAATAEAVAGEVGQHLAAAAAAAQQAAQSNGHETVSPALSMGTDAPVQLPVATNGHGCSMPSSMPSGRVVGAGPLQLPPINKRPRAKKPRQWHGLPPHLLASAAPRALASPVLDASGTDESDGDDDVDGVARWAGAAVPRRRRHQRRAPAPPHGMHGAFAGVPAPSAPPPGGEATAAALARLDSLLTLQAGGDADGGAGGDEDALFARALDQYGLLGGSSDGEGGGDDDAFAGVGFTAGPAGGAGPRPRFGALPAFGDGPARGFDDLAAVPRRFGLPQPVAPGTWPLKGHGSSGNGNGQGGPRPAARKAVPPRKLLLGDGAQRRAKHHNPWALEEAEALVEGVARCGGGRWADIKKLGFPAIEHRTAVDLKDKWRNLLRIALLPAVPGAKGAAAEKRREIPVALLQRVRHLAATQGKTRLPDGRLPRGRAPKATGTPDDSGLSDGE
jgi:hypothetical protein